MKSMRSFVALVAYLALPVLALAQALPTYSSTLVDANCTNLYNAAGLFGNDQVQTTGSPDGLCDHDTRILTGALVADTVFGPFTLDPDFPGLLVNLDTDAVSGGSSDHQVCILNDSPNEPGTMSTRICAVAVASALDTWYYIGNLGASLTGATSWASPNTTTTLNVRLPQTYWIRLNLVSATSWSGSLTSQPAQ